MNDDNNRKDSKFTFRATKQELADIDRRARIAKMTRTDFLLACAKAPEDLGRLNGNQQKNLYEEIKTIAQDLETILETLPLSDGRKSVSTKEVELKLGDAIHAIYKRVDQLHGPKN
jgi:hypothetical protein